MPKLNRKAFMTFLDADFKNVSEMSHNWFLLGKDLEELSVEMNPDTETTKNILGETSVKDNGYEPSMSADPYYANTSDSIYPKIKSIAMDRLVGDECKTSILEVIIADTDDEQHEAWIENVIIKPQSYGGDTGGFAIPFDVNFDGGRKKGKVTFSGSVPTFVAE